jgi:hypothetical protein
LHGLLDAAQRAFASANFSNKFFYKKHRESRPTSGRASVREIFAHFGDRFAYATPADVSAFGLRKIENSD